MKIHLPKQLSRTHLPRVGDRRKPARDWLRLLSLAFIVLAVSIGWNIWTFLRITSGEAVGDQISAVVGPDVSALEQVREVFRARAEEAQRYQAEYRFVDPSK